MARRTMNEPTAPTQYSPAVCLRLINEHAGSVEYHCTLCTFFHNHEESCGHKQAHSISRSITATPFSDCSFYTAQSDISLPELDNDIGSLSSRSSSSTIRASVVNYSYPMTRRRSLRRTSSPTDCSLRDLNKQQQSAQVQLRQQQSEEQLQRVYEMQILAYLNAEHADLDTICD